MKLLFLLAALSAPTAVMAAGGVTLASDIFVERIRPGADGGAVKVLEPPKAVAPGDQLVFILSYKNNDTEPAADFVVTNPVPDAVAFAAADDAEADVSVDWGHSWGKLSLLSVKRRDGSTRPAAPADVTHVRWIVRQPIGVGETGKVSYRAVAR